MPPLNLDDFPEPDDGPDGWRFDPNSPPAMFTKEMIGRMSLADIKRCRDPEQSPLDEEQQASFDAARAAYWAAFNGRIDNAMKSMMGNISANISANIVPTLPAPKLPSAKDLMGLDAARLMQIKVPGVLAPQFDTARQNLVADLARTVALGRSDTADTGDEQAAMPPRDEHLAMDTPDERAKRIEEDAAQLSTLAAVAGLLTEQAQISARGYVFYVLVGLATTLGGLSTLAALDTEGQRVFAGGGTVLVAVLASCWYFFRQRKDRDS